MSFFGSNPGYGGEPYSAQQGQGMRGGGGMYGQPQYAQQPGQGPGMMQPGGGAGGPAQPSGGQPGMQANAGNPQANQGQGSYFGNMGAYAPAPYQAFGAIPQINPQLIQGGDIGGQLGPYAGAVDQAMQPMFNQQSEQLSSDMAGRGIFNSGAANAAQGNLLSQQFGQVLGQSLPMAQQNLQGNQQAENQALAANAQAYGNVTGSNEQNYNNYLNQLYGGNLQRGQSLQGAYLGNYAPVDRQGLYGQAMGNAGNAYQNSYNAGMGAAGPLAGAFGNLFGPSQGAPGGGYPGVGDTKGG